MKKAVWPVALAVLGCSAPCFAQDVVTADPESIASVLQKAGYRAQIGKDEGGDPMIDTGAGGYAFTIYFYGCEKGKNCTTVQFFANFDPGSRKVTAEDVNTYNLSRRFGTGTVNTKGEPVIRYDIDLDDGGMSSKLFLDNLEFWEISIARFADMVFTQEVSSTAPAAK